MPDEQKILPCPFPREDGSPCGWQPGIPPATSEFVYCMRCGASGPHCETRAEAISRWNALVGAAEIARLAKKVSEWDWGTSCTESYHSQRVEHMVNLRAAIQRQERGE